MRCTLQAMDELSTIDDYKDYIYELWIILQEVEALRYCEQELAKIRVRSFRDVEKMEEIHDEIKQHRREIDEWFRTLREE